MTTDKRLREILDYSKLSTRALAIKCGLQQVTLDRQIKGMRSVSIETLIGIGNTFPEISMDWLVLGKGEMLRAENVLDTKYLDTISTLNDALTAQGNTIKILKDRIKELESK